MRTLLRAAAAVVAVLAVATVVVLAAPAPASAHDVLISTDPADGAAMASSPGSVVLTFDQPALAIGTELLVTGPGGRVVSAGRARCVNSTVTQDLGGPLPTGHYDVEWRVTSADGHPVSGRFAYTTSGPGRGAVARAPARGAGRTAASAGAGHAGSSSDSGPGAALWWVVGAVAVVVVVAGSAAVVRRRSRSARAQR